MSDLRKCVTVSYGRVKGKAKQFAYHQPCLYQEYQTKSGSRVWKLVQPLGRARRSRKLAIEDASYFCHECEVPYIENIRQWRAIEID
jgi:hypothetical protein